MTDTYSSSPEQAFTGGIRPAKLSFFYQGGLGIVALTMVLLPVIYIALIIAMGWLVWWHLLNDTMMFENLHGRATLIALVLYLGPAVVGVIFILFLVKPLFSRAPKPPPPLKLLEANEPQLFALVRKVCEVVGAPVPREIRLDAQVNASAGFRWGWLSFFTHDLVLTIGLLMAAGMTMRQLTGVLAHEFGHFAQGAGMRFSFIIRSVNGWFARVVYERDHWDERLEDWATTENLWLKLVFLLAKGGVWMGRKVLWCLMQAGHAISCFMSRQMEFDADSYEAKVAGSDEFPRTAERLRLLSVAHGAAMNDAYQTFQTKELPDDLPALVVWRESTMQEKVRGEIEKAVQESRTAWNHTHPADADRVKAALALQEPGVFHLEAPAAELFSDFISLSRAVTRDHFQHQLEVPLDKVQFRSSARMVQDRQAADEADRSVDAFYGERFHFLRLSPLDLNSPPNADEARARMEEHGPAYDPLLKKYVGLETKLLNQTVGSDLLKAKFTFPNPGEFDLSANTEVAAAADMQNSQRQLNELKVPMQPFELAAAQRLAAGVNQRLARGDDAMLQHVITAQKRLSEVLPHLMQAQRATRSLDLLFNNASNHNDGVMLERIARGVAQRVSVAVQQAISTLGDAAHPYMEGHPPIAGALRLPEKGDNDFARAYKLSQVCSDALVPLLVRVTGDLCRVALAEESTGTPG
jgi:Zn-dependent protease with chaperone function